VQNEIWYKEEMFTGEDFDFLLRCLQWAPRMWVASKPMYFYQLRSNSSSRNRSLSDWHRIANENDELANEYSGKDAEKIKKLLLLRGKHMRKSIEFKKIMAAKRNRNWKLFAANIGKNWQNVGFFSLLALRKMVSHSKNTFIGRASRQSSHQLLRSAETGRS
jgi:hypothetical protein